jgi:hypothetical protein
MKASRSLLLVCALVSYAAAGFAADPLVVNVRRVSGERQLFDPTYQFLFFATLEGLYRDGVSQVDVEALLVRQPKGGYVNFIYTCPICMPVQGAIETYKLRPAINYSKTENHQTEERTFGFGLPRETGIALRSEKASVRLGVINELVSKWISYRMEHSGFTEEQKKALIEELKKGREEGMKALQNFAKDANGKDSVKNFSPGYVGGDECAICNAALQMPLKLKERP